MSTSETAPGMQLSHGRTLLGVCWLTQMPPNGYFAVVAATGIGGLDWAGYIGHYSEHCDERQAIEHVLSRGAKLEESTVRCLVPEVETELPYRG